MKTTLLKGVLHLVISFCALLIFVEKGTAQTTLFNANFSNNGGDNAWTLTSSTGLSWQRSAPNQDMRINPRPYNANNADTRIAAPVISTLGFDNLSLSIDIDVDAEATWDGMLVEYNVGAGWFIAGNTAGGFYNSTINAVGTNGWSGTVSGTRTLDLSAFNPAFNNNANVQFRVSFFSDTSFQVGQGAIFDDFIITGTPIIVGPEIELTGNSNTVTDGDTTPSLADHTDFGGSAIGVPITRTFTINNTGTANLTLSNPVITGSGNFIVSTGPSILTVPAGGNTTFSVTYTPTALTTDTATITIINNDSDENPYNFNIEGNGIDPTIEVSLYCEEFENGSHNWTLATNGTGSFSRGTEATATAGSAGLYMYTDRSGDNYLNSSSLVYSSPVIDLSGYENLRFSIDVWYDTSNDGSLTTPTSDGMQVQFSEDGGTTWSVLGGKDEITSWYNTDTLYSFDNTINGFPAYDSGWTGNSSGWTTAIIDLPSQAFDNNPDARFRVSFRSDNSITDVGVAFDNVCISGFPIITVPDPSCGPAGIGENLKLWLRADEISGITDGSTLSLWEDQAYNTTYTNAVSPSGQEPVYKNNATDNLNFHPVVHFDGTTSSMYGRKGFYTDEFYIVVKPSSPITAASPPNDIFCADDYTTSQPGQDITGFQMGDTSARFTNDVVAFNQSTQDGYGVALTSTTTSYSNGNIFNGRANAANNGAQLYHNGLNIGNTTANAGEFDRITNSRYWLGRSELFGASYDGDIVEVISYSRRNNDIDQQKIQSYLATKYGITLGTNGTSLDYVDTDANIIWDISQDSGAFNYDIAGIGRDDCSALNQKQSKSINSDALLTFGLGNIFPTNADNSNTFTNDKDFLMWGNDNGDLSSASPIAVDLSAGIGGISTPVDFIAINRVWKVVESGTINATKVSIPEAALSAVITPPGNFLMFISDTPNFNPTSDYRVMQPNGTNLETTYDFDGTKYITFGYAPERRYERSVTFGGTADYLDAGDVLDLASEFTLSLWVNRGANSANKDLIAKRNNGPWTEGYSLRLNNTGNPRMVWKNSSGGELKFNSSVSLPLDQWHHVALIYKGGTATFYINGIEDTSLSGAAPAPTDQHFTIGAVDSENATNFFDGILDEVRIWKAALTPDQLRYVMNQEIIEHTDSSVNGKIIPQNISKNDIESIPWTLLDGYFPMNLFAYTNIKDESSNGHIAAIRNLNTVSAQTAPLPYKSLTDGLWSDPATWENGSMQYQPGTVANASLFAPVNWNIVQTNHEVTSQTNSEVLALDVQSSKVLIANDSKIEVSHYLNLDGILDLVGESQLVQTLDSDLDLTSTGHIERDQQGTADRYTYNYWTSPVSTINASAINQDYTVAGIMRDGSDVNNPLPMNFTGGYDGNAGTPITLSSFWFFKYANQISSTYAAWQYVGPNGTMKPGESWTMKGPGTGGVSTPQNYVFVGKPNNATTAQTITLPINGGNDYLIGNPFPSALDANDFIMDNPQLDGTLYFWEHWGGGSHYLAEYQGGYAMYNISGGTPAVSHPLVSSTGTGTKEPQRYIPVGQGFFVKANSTGTIAFSNTQRNFVKEAPTQSIFLDPTAGKAASSDPALQLDDTQYDAVDKRTKFRIGFEIMDGIKRQLLLTLDKNTTLDYDHGYDGEVTDLQNSDMTWLVEDRKTIIQGAPKSKEAAIFPLFIQLEENEDILISLEDEQYATEFEFVALWDKFEDSYTNLRDQGLSINLTAGIYDDRFAIVFKRKTDQDEDTEEETEEEDEDGDTLSLEDDTFTLDSFTVFYSKDQTKLFINNPSHRSIETASLYNMLGQKVNTWSVQGNSTEIALPLSKISSGTYILSFSDGQHTVSAKVIIY